METFLVKRVRVSGNEEVEDMVTDDSTEPTKTTVESQNAQHHSTAYQFHKQHQLTQVVCVSFHTTVADISKDYKDQSVHFASFQNKNLVSVSRAFNSIA